MNEDTSVVTDKNVSEITRSKSKTINGWNMELETVIKGWGEEAKSLGWMNSKAASSRSRRGVFINASIGLLGIVGGSGAYLNTHCDEILARVWGSFAIASAALAAVQAALRDSDRALEYKTAASEFQAFANEIESELAISRNSRTECKKFMARQKKAFNKLLYKSPEIPDSIQLLYKKKFGESGIAVPDITDGIEKIYVNTK